MLAADACVVVGTRAVESGAKVAAEAAVEAGLADAALGCRLATLSVGAFGTAEKSRRVNMYRFSAGEIKS